MRYIVMSWSGKTHKLKFRATTHLRKHKGAACCRDTTIDAIPFKGDAKFQIYIACFIDEMMLKFFVINISILL